MLFISSLILAAVSCSAINLTFSAGESGPTAADPIEVPAQSEATEASSDQDKSSGLLPIKEGACANSLMPLEVGNQWVYDEYDGGGSAEVAQGEPTPTPNSTLTWTVIEVENGIATMRVSAEEFDIEAQYTLQCDQGAILTFPTLNMELSMSGGGTGSVGINYENQSGMFLPSVDTFKANNWDHQWDTTILISGNLETQPIEGQTLNMTFEESPWLMSWSTTGAGDQAFEPVEVAAGRFERALKLEQEAVMSFDMQLEGMGLIEANFDSTANQWFVEGVGLIKTQTLSSGIVLNDMELPTSGVSDFTSTMELKEFRQGVEVR